MFVIGLLEPDECLVVLAEAQISVHKSPGGNVTRLSACLQLREEPKGVTTSPCVGIGADQHTHRTWATVRKRNHLLKDSDRILRLMVADQCKSKEPKDLCVVRPYSLYAAQLAYGLVVAAALEQNPSDASA